MNRKVPGDMTPEISDQQRFWNAWNAEFREDPTKLAPVNQRQAQFVLQRLRELGPERRDIVEVGCGSGWLCGQMRSFGSVCGFDLSDEVLERSRARYPDVRFVAGDFQRMNLPVESADVVVTLEVLSHVSEQREFMRRLAQLLRPGGFLLLATQNRFVLERFEAVRPAQPGQIRHWVNARELRALLRPHFQTIKMTSLVTVGHSGVLRFLNSARLNAVLAKLGVDASYDLLKESMLLGHTLMVFACKPLRANGGAK